MPGLIVEYTVEERQKNHMCINNLVKVTQLRLFVSLQYKQLCDEKGRQYR